MIFIVILLVILILSLWVQFYFLFSIVKNLTIPEKTYNEIPQPFVTYTHPELVNEDKAGQDDNSVIVNPKTPQRIEWEEEEALRKMQLGPR